MIKLIDLLKEAVDIPTFLHKWVGTQKSMELPKFYFTLIKKQYPEVVKFGKVYRGYEISLDQFKKYTGNIVTTTDDFFSTYDEPEVIDELDSKIRQYIFDTEKGEYKSWSKDIQGVNNFVTILFNSGKFGYEGTPEIVIVSQKSEYIDLYELVKKLNIQNKGTLGQELNELEETHEVISILEPNFTIEGFSFKQNQLIPYRGSIDKVLSHYYS
jgi:hypothetical protein